MITLNDYLYSGDTVLKILHRYHDDLKKSALSSHNSIDIIHCNFILQQIDLLEHNDFLTAQSQELRGFYMYMARKYPYLAFTFKGRIKSVIRTEEKFNGYITEFVYDYYRQHGEYPTTAQIKDRLVFIRDMIAYRIVISVPQCHLKKGEDRREAELDVLYEVANALPDFLEERGFSVQVSEIKGSVPSEKLKPSLRPYYRDYIENPGAYGYQSLHITFFDITARCYIEVQLRTKEMDDNAEIGAANHQGYEKQQEIERTRRNEIPEGECTYFDEALEREILLQKLDLSKINVNMFSAADNSLINDGCGLFRGRLILPFEHLSRFQNDTEE